MAGVATNVLTLVKLVIVLHILLHWLAYGVVLVVVHYVGIGHILSMDTTSAFYQWQLLSIKILIRI